MPDTPLSAVAPDLPVRVVSTRHAPPMPPGAPPMPMQIKEMVEFSYTSPNFQGEMVTMPYSVVGDSAQGAVLKQCVAMYDELRRRLAEVAAERDALKAEAKKKGK